MVSWSLPPERGPRAPAASWERMEGVEVESGVGGMGFSISDLRFTIYD